MVCNSVRAGSDCALMTRKGCSYNGGTCHPIVDACVGCDNIAEYPSGKYCLAYPNPPIKWKNGGCNFATHLKTAEKRDTQKINPLKASKRNTGR